MKEENPAGITLPRRSAMLKQLLDLWYVRLEVVAETEESLQQARTLLILDQAGRIPYLQYNTQTEQLELEIKTDRDPLELKAALESIKEGQELCGETSCRVTHVVPPQLAHRVFEQHANAGP